MIRLFTKQFFILFFMLLLSTSFASTKEIALTIDDLPFVGEGKKFHLNLIIKALTDNEIPATGFVIANEVTPKTWSILHKFHDAGLSLGNHTYSHLNLNQANTEAYIQEIEAADKILLPILTNPKFFRFPYLATSQGDKKNKVLRYLSAKNYQVAPITIDSKDFLFNQILYGVPEKARRGFLKDLKTCYLNFIWQQTLKAEEQHRLAHKADKAQILLIHANLLNAYVLPDIIQLYKQNGYRFIPLEEALKKSNPKDNQTWQNPDEPYMEWD